MVGFLNCHRTVPPKKNASPIAVNQVKYAKNFKWYSLADYDLIEVSANGFSSGTHQRYLIVDRSKEIPADVAYDVLIRPSLNSIIATSTPQVSVLERLGFIDALVGFPQPGWIASTDIQKRVKKGQIKDIGANNGLNIESILSLQPDVFFGFEVDGNNPAYTRLQQLNIPIVMVHDWQEKSPLGKAEWLLFFGVILGEKQNAIDQFQQTKERYARLLNQIHRPKPSPNRVMAGAVYKDQWFAPGGGSFFAGFLSDCEVEYIFSSDSQTGSLALSIEKLLVEGQKADIWMTPGAFDTYKALASEYPMIASLPSFQNKRIFTYKKEWIDGEPKILYFQDASFHPDRVVEDLLQIFYPETFPSKSWHYFSPLK